MHIYTWFMINLSAYRITHIKFVEYKLSRDFGVVAIPDIPPCIVGGGGGGGGMKSDGKELAL